MAGRQSPGTPHQPSSSDIKSLFKACEDGKLDEVRKLLQDGKMDVNVRLEKNEQTPLHQAAYRGRYEVVEELVTKWNADLEAVNRNQLTPLGWACKQGHGRVLELLLRLGANPNAKDKKMRTPLHVAAMEGHMEVCKILIQGGADTTAKNKKGFSPYDCAGDWLTGLSDAEMAKKKEELQAQLRPFIDNPPPSNPVSKEKPRKEQQHSPVISRAPRRVAVHANVSENPPPSNLTKEKLRGEQHSPVVPQAPWRPVVPATDSLIPIKLQKMDPQLVLKVKNNPEDYYQMSALPRGKAVILNNEDFSRAEKFGDRTGSSTDEKNLEEVFRALGFEIDVWRDLTAQEIITSVDELRKLDFHKNADAFVFIVLSHGLRGAIYGVDGGKVDITKEIIDLFDGKRCPQLIDKPKLFFIQACQGDQKTTGVPRPDGGDEESIAPWPVGKRAFREEPEADGVRNVHEKADMMECYATVPGYVSWRDAEEGSWFMRELVLSVIKYSHRLHVDEMLTKVNKALIEHKGRRFTQVGESVKRLSKNLFFLPIEDSAPSLEIKPSKKDCYKMDSPLPGFMLIIHNVNFEEGLPKRLGSDADRDRLKNIFENRGFRTEVRNDLTKAVMLRQIQALAEDANELDMFDCVALAILSHGEEGNILGVDGLSISMEEVIQPFSRTASPNLAGKPKLFILQVYHSRESFVIETSVGSPQSSDAQVESKDVEEITKQAAGLHVAEKKKKVLDPDQDMLIVYSQIPFEDDTLGSYYIQSLCNVFEIHSEKKHVLDMLDKTNDEITNYGVKTNVQPIETLTKEWYLKPL